VSLLTSWMMLQTKPEFGSVLPSFPWLVTASEDTRMQTLFQAQL
jgi:hypothetical protein